MLSIIIVFNRRKLLNKDKKSGKVKRFAEKKGNRRKDQNVRSR